MGTKAERVYEARRQGLLARVAGETGAERAEELITAWEEEAERRAIRRRSDDFWKMAGRGCSRSTGGADATTDR